MMSKISSSYWKWNQLKVDMDCEIQQYLTTNQAEKLKKIERNLNQRSIHVIYHEVSVILHTCGQYKCQLLGEGEKSLGGEDQETRMPHRV